MKASRQDIETLLNKLGVLNSLRKSMTSRFEHLINFSEELQDAMLMHPDLKIEMEQYIEGFPAEEVEEIVISLYRKKFTKEDVTNIIQFFNSVSGKKFLDTGSVLQEEIARDSIPVVKRYYEQTMKRFNELNQFKKELVRQNEKSKESISKDGKK